MKIYRTISLLLVLYGCETWSFTLREEHRLAAFENRVLRKIFRPRRDQVGGSWKRVNYGERYDLYTSPNIRVAKCRRMKWAGHVARIKERTGEERRCAYRILVGK